MTGNIDKPLGIKNTEPGSVFGRLRYPLFAGLILLTGASGFLLNGYLGSNEPNENSTQIRKQNPKTAVIANNGGKNQNTQGAGGFTKRPNLPVDENAPGLQEMNVTQDTDIPKVIPRKRPENITRLQILSHLPDRELTEEIDGNILPVKSPDGLRALDVYSRKAETEGNFGVARIVLIVGGLGISQSSTQQAINTLPANVTLAFAPYGNSLTRWMTSARKKGHELLLQLPMEPFGYPQSTAGEHSLLSNQTQIQNQMTLHWSLGRMTNYVGVMNYLGGKMLTTPDKLSPIFEELSQRGLMFVDDGLIRNSMSAEIAKATDLPFTKAHMTIDNLRTRQAIAKKLKELEDQAKRTGLAIGVATAFPDTISQIAKFLKSAKRRGIELTPVSAIASEPRG